MPVEHGKPLGHVFQSRLETHVLNIELLLAALELGDVDVNANGSAVCRPAGLHLEPAAIVITMLRHVMRGRVRGEPRCDPFLRLPRRRIWRLARNDCAHDLRETGTFHPYVGSRSM